MKKLISAIILSSAIIAPVQAQQAPKTFSGVCMINNESYRSLTDIPCVVSTNSRGLYDNRSQSDMSWSIIYGDKQVTVKCDQNGNGVYIKPQQVTPDVTFPEYQWYGSCKGLRTMGITYLFFESEGSTLRFPQWKV